MRKFFTSMLLVQAVFCLYPKAQSTDVLRNELDAIFQYVDKSQVPTGYLEEYGAGFVPLRSFNGLLTDSNRFNFDSWQLIYGQIRASKIYGTTALPSLTMATNNIKTAGNHAANMFAVPLLLMDYGVLNPYAVQQNLFTVNNDQIFDVANRTQSPYQQKVLFGATPAVNYSNTGTVQVLFKPDLFYTNTGKSISTVHVDFNDQNGYVQVSLNTAFTKTYTDTGYKRWKIKLTCTDNSVYECYTDFQVTVIVTASNVPARYGDNPDILELPFNAVLGPGPWAHSGGKVTVWYSRKGTERTLNKPFIIVEGYDASEVAPSLKKPLNYRELLNLIRNQPSGYDFIGNLDDIAGYDLVFLDFNNGTDNLQRNAALFKEVLAWVNQTKAGNPNPEPNVVLGLSMGGMITRYALADLTKQNIATGTRLLISHDSPHQGANTPLGLQYMTRFLASRGGIGGFLLNELDVVKQGNDLLDEPATEQLLIYKATGPTTYTANTFLNTTYRNMITFTASDPQPAYRFIAIASGSECGVPLFAAGEDIVNVNGATFAGLPFFPYAAGEIRLSARIKSLPASGQSTNIAHLEIKRTISLFFGLINRTKILESFDVFSPSGALPWDGAPGGTVDVAKKLGDNNSRNLIVPLGLSVTAASITVQEKVSFVPITSALDITTVNAESLTAKYVGGISPGNPSRAENFKAQEQYTDVNQPLQYNKDHRFFTAKNAEWLFNEMQGITPNNLNCSNNCQLDFTMIANQTLCTNHTYSISPVIPGTIITWSVYPNDGTVTFIPNAATVDVDLSSATAGITYTLTATVTGNCNFGSVSTQFSVPASSWSGTVIGMQGYWNTVYTQPLAAGDNYLYTGSGVNYFEIWNEGVAEQTAGYWEYISGDRASYGVGPHAIAFDLWWLAGVDAYYNYHFTDACGSHSIPYHFMTTNDYPPAGRMAQTVENYQLKLSPNPASNAVTVSVVELAGNKKADAKVFDYSTPKNIRVYDKFGNIILQRNEIISKSGLRLNVLLLKSDDMYNVIVDDGNGLRLSSKLIKQ